MKVSTAMVALVSCMAIQVGLRKHMEGRGASRGDTTAIAGHPAHPSHDRRLGWGPYPPQLAILNPLLLPLFQAMPCEWALAGAALRVVLGVVLMLPVRRVSART